MMKSLKLHVTLMTLVLAQAAVANPLYSWTTKDGTPTYSPDPPPKGVAYEIVGADLKPLQQQPASAPQATAPAASQSNPPASQAADQTNSSNNLVVAPTPVNCATANAKPVKANNAWHPVVYANDPNPIKASAEPVSAAAQPSAEVTAVNQISSECISVLKQVTFLEDQFASAFTAEQMDDAVVRLNDFRKQNKGSCGL